MLELAAYFDEVKVDHSLYDFAKTQLRQEINQHWDKYYVTIFSEI